MRSAYARKVRAIMKLNNIVILFCIPKNFLALFDG
jgi:hypothetical protein